MFYQKRVILPDESVKSMVLTTPIGEHLIRKMISVYEGGFARGEGTIPSVVGMKEKKQVGKL